MPNKFDLIIIGGGVIGSAIAREAARYNWRVAVLEKEDDICTQTSARNTGMIHGGFMYTTGSLKAQCCVEGNREFQTIAEELDIPFKRTGKLIVGFTDEHRKRLELMMERGQNNGVVGLEMIDRERMDELDPTAGGNFAMYCPSSGIVDPFQFSIALAENAVKNGVQYFLETEVIGYERLGEYDHVLYTNRETYQCRWVVNAAGLNSAKISTMLGIPGYVLRGVKGEYIVLDKRAGEYARIPVYPAPNPDNTFDVHATPTVDGNVLIGPDSKTTIDFQDYDSTSVGIEGLIAEGGKMFTTMKRDFYIRNFAGIRPKRIDPETGKVQDFVLERRDDIPGVINLVGIESPGLTCAVPLARRAVELVKEVENLSANPRFTPYRQAIVRFNEQTDERKEKLIEENPDYGEIVCRCEEISRAEILEAIHNPLGVHTVNGIKIRTRASMGRCQGGYCETRLAEMIQQETKMPVEDIRLGIGNSKMFTGRVREVPKHV